MTLILAAKYDSGIAFAYDKNKPYHLDVRAMNSGNITLGSKNRPSTYRDKVIIAGDIAVGVDGDPVERNIVANFRNVQEIYENKVLAVRSALEHRSNLRQKSSETLPNHTAPKETYIIGFLHNESPKLFFYDDQCSNGVIEVNRWAGIGFGVYPEVWSHLEENEGDGSLEDILKILNEGMDIALEVNNSDEKVLLGKGFTVINNEGVKRKQYL